MASWASKPIYFGSSGRCSVVFLVGCRDCFLGGREESETSTDGRNAVTLWRLLEAICLMMPATGAAVSARPAKEGFVGYALVIALGLALGVGCAWTMRTTGAVAVARISRQSASWQEQYFRALYLAAGLWIIASLVLGVWVSSVALRLIL